MTSEGGSERQLVDFFLFSYYHPSTALNCLSMDSNSLFRHVNKPAFIVDFLEYAWLCKHARVNPC